MTLKTAKKYLLILPLVLATVFVLQSDIYGVDGTASFTDTGAEDTTSTTIIEGNSVNIEVDLDGDFLVSDPPFLAYQGINSLPDDILSYTAVGSGYQYLLRAGPGSATGYSGSAWPTGQTDPTSTTPPRPTYDLQFQFLTHMSEGSVREEYGSSSRISDVTASPTLAITAPSRIVLSVVNAETTQGDITFKEIVGATGYFSRFNGGDAIIASNELETTRKMDVQIISPAGEEITLTFNTTQRFVTDPDTNVSSGITAGTEFQVTFNPPTVNSLLLRVITPQQAVNDIAEAINDDPENPEVTDSNNLPFIGLREDDTLNAISEKNFTLLRAIERFNVPAEQMQIIWEWIPVDDTGAEVTDKTDPLYNVVRISEAARNTYSATVNPLIEDQDGLLRYTVQYEVPYDYTGSTVVPDYDGIVRATGDIDITIKGTGIPPEILTVSTTQGTVYPNPADPTAPYAPVVTLNTTVPRTMDVYEGGLENYPLAPLAPFKFNVVFSFGKLNAAASYAVIEAQSNTGTQDACDIFIENSGVPHTIGERIENPNAEGEGTFAVDFVAKKPGDVLYIIKFYNASDELMNTQIEMGRINIKDSTPSSDSSLKELRLNSPELKDEFKDVTIDVPMMPNQIATINVPYVVENVSLYALQNDPLANRNMTMNITDQRIPRPSGPASPLTVVNGIETSTINVANALDEEVMFELIVTAEDMTTTAYTLVIVRDPPSVDATLSSLNIFQTDAEDAENVLEGFSPDVLRYEMTVPYRVPTVWMSYEKGWPGATVSTNGANLLFSDKIRFDLTYDDTVSPINNKTIITLDVTAEDGVNKNQYVIEITRLPPSTNTNVTGMEFTDKGNNPLPFDLGQVFAPADRQYYLTIPYSTEEMKLNLTPEDEYASSVNATYMRGGSNYTVSEKIVLGEEIPILTLDVSRSAMPDDQFAITVFVEAEKQGLYTDPPYTVNVTRAPPNDNTGLADMTVKDIGGADIPSYVFNPSMIEYNDLFVEFDVETVVITPQPATSLSTVTVDGTEVNEGRPSISVNLKQGVPKTVVVQVTAESGAVQDYLLHFLRKDPSTDARLAELEVSGTMGVKPSFIPSVTAYEAIMEKDVNAVTVMVVPVEESSTIRVDGIATESGIATEPIDITYEYQTVIIEVTAQDGETTMEYQVSIHNPNLLPKSDDASLQNLIMYNSELLPLFMSNLDSYEAFSLPDTRFVELEPIPADAYAEMEVLQGSKMLSEANGRYAATVSDGKNDFTINLTSSDGTAEATYTVALYKNDEENAGNYRPITAEMLDFENENPIIVDIRQYGIISSDVFTTLKEYPDTVIIFQGNGYSYTFKGSDLNVSVPFADYYDLSLNYTSPDGPVINDLLGALGNAFNPGYPVHLYFSQSGSLPGPGTLNVTLGDFYGNKTLYWNYYNKEFNKIDYYGYFRTNNTGTFSVPIDHHSTYVITENPVVGAEDLSSRFGTPDLSLATPDKTNPNTSAPHVTQNIAYLSAVSAQNFVVLNRNTQSIPQSSALF